MAYPFSSSPWAFPLLFDGAAALSQLRQQRAQSAPKRRGEALIPLFQQNAISNQVGRRVCHMFLSGPFMSRPFMDTRRPWYTIPASETLEGKERVRAYYESLGRFVQMFSEVETAVSHTLWHYAKTKPEIAKVIFSGAKIEAGSSYIKQLAEATSAPESAKEGLGYVLQQLGIVNTVRNYVVHYGATSIAEGPAVVSNALKAKGEPTVFPISPALLDQMTADLRKITFHLNYRHLGRPRPKSAEVQNTLDGVLNSPWQYKHPAPQPTRSKTALARQLRKRGPKPPRRP
jgi:hypothetical protein